MKKKIKVRGSYKDKIGCTVKIIGKLRNSTHPYIGIVDWATCTDERSIGSNSDIGQYDEHGASEFAHERRYDLVVK